MKTQARFMLYDQPMLLQTGTEKVDEASDEQVPTRARRPSDHDTARQSGAEVVRQREKVCSTPLPCVVLSWTHTSHSHCRCYPTISAPNGEYLNF